MANFSGHYEASITDSVGIRGQISDFQDQKSHQYDICKYLADRQYIEFSPEDGLISSDYCPSITTQATNLNPPVLNTTHAAHNGLLHWHESSVQSIGLQQIIDPIIINEEHIAPAFYGSAVAERAVYSETKSIVTEEREDYEASHLHKLTLGNVENDDVLTDKDMCAGNPLTYRGQGHTAPAKMKKRKTDQYAYGSVMETYVQVSAQKGPLKKSKGHKHKSSQSSSISKDHEQNANPKSDVIRGDPPQLLTNNVMDKPKDEPQKDYIHLRTRRGQATDSHSLAERVRREKISERMRVLQDLVPGCNKVTGKALVLETIINYVQSLQSQVEILSGKLTSVLSRYQFDLPVNGHPAKEVEDIHGSLMYYKQDILRGCQ